MDDLIDWAVAPPTHGAETSEKGGWHQFKILTNRSAGCALKADVVKFIYGVTARHGVAARIHRKGTCARVAKLQDARWHERSARAKHVAWILGYLVVPGFAHCFAQLLTLTSLSFFSVIAYLLLAGLGQVIMGAGQPIVAHLPRRRCHVLELAGHLKCSVRAGAQVFHSVFAHLIEARPSGPRPDSDTPVANPFETSSPKDPVLASTRLGRILFGWYLSPCCTYCWCSPLVRLFTDYHLLSESAGAP